VICRATLFCVPTVGADDTAILEIVESAVAQNLRDYVHAVQLVAPDLRAAATACAGGVAAFVGVGSPLTTVKGTGSEITDHDVDAAEAFFRRCGVDSAVFEVAPWISRATAERLSRRGYEIVGSEDVVVRRRPFDAPAPLHRVEPVEDTGWPGLMLRMNEAPDSPQWRATVEACAVLPGAIRLGVLDNSGAWIACAQVLPVAGVGLFANDATLNSARRRGAQTATIHARLRAVASHVLSCLAAEVAAGSASERNYLRCGFHLAYARAYYARKIM
jgi:hypothetical protein